MWAPTARVVDLILPATARHAARRMTRDERGFFSVVAEDVRPGTRYSYRIDDGATLPDPASRFQPCGVDGPSAIVDPHGFVWSDGHWTWPPITSIYELHVGTFSHEGTFAGAESHLGELEELGVDAIELMPVAECAGRRNWGYDGVDLFAPSHHYGVPDDLRRLVDRAHAHGIAVILDVVYNHVGPDGAYLSAFSPYYFSRRHQSPWGAGVNLDDAYSEIVRDFFVENALHWIHEYHVDGLRLDATHELRDDSDRHFLAEFVARVRSGAGRPVWIAAEDDRNDARLVRSPAEGGFGFDAVWADDFHHHVRRAAAGDDEGYFAHFSGTAADLALTIRQGWFYTGQAPPNGGMPRGTDPVGLRPPQFIVCLQNHDQVGNRALGERLHHQIDAATYRALSALLLCAPQTPLLFMGQEWAASTPFLYFTDHDEDLGRRVTEGRRNEFSQFRGFADPDARARIPDPQDEATFAQSRLEWSERETAPHTQTLRLYQTLLRLRREELCPSVGDDTGSTAAALDDDTILILRRARHAPLLVVVVRLRHAGVVAVPDWVARSPAAAPWSVALTTEDPPFADAGCPPRVRFGHGQPEAVEFRGPAAVILRGWPARHP